MNDVALPIGPRTASVLGLASVAGLMMLCWPLLLQAEAGQRVEPPFLFLVLLPLVVIVVAQLLQITLVPWLESAVTRAFL